MKIRENFTCPLEIVHDIIKGKWKTIIIFQLRKGTLSFSALLKLINGITTKMLIEQLHEMIEFGLVHKKSYDGYPLKVDYYLTDRGKKIVSAIEIMQSVGIEYMLEHGMEKTLCDKGIPC